MWYNIFMDIDVIKEYIFQRESIRKFFVEIEIMDKMWEDEHKKQKEEEQKKQKNDING